MMKRNLFLLSIALFCADHSVVAHNEPAGDLNAKISQSIEKVLPYELLKATSNLENIQQLDREMWDNQLKKAELSYDTIWQTQRFYYRSIKGMSAIILYLNYLYLKNRLRFGLPGKEEALVIVPSLLCGLFGLLKSWKCDRADDIVNMIKKRIAILRVNCQS